MTDVNVNANRVWADIETIVKYVEGLKASDAKFGEVCSLTKVYSEVISSQSFWGEIYWECEEGFCVKAYYNISSDDVKPSHLDIDVIAENTPAFHITNYLSDKFKLMVEYLIYKVVFKKEPPDDPSAFFAKKIVEANFGRIMKELEREAQRLEEFESRLRNARK